MGRVFRILLCSAVFVTMTVGTIGCGSNKAQGKKELTPEEEEKYRQLGKDLGINMYEKADKGKQTKKS